MTLRLVTRSTRLIQPLQSALPILRTSNIRQYSLKKDWKGSSTDEHAVRRAKSGDTADIPSSASLSGMNERRLNEGVADDTKSQGMTERGGSKQGKKAKEEHPNAPEPIIGMNDERAQFN
ncbi:uncharacterized protein N7511_003426 [Penicillium nucicola]|uniref:uncharacterized protein n=1 Tax=Penicillium nucicola TaxID=1850975 RepID=UPI002545193F|nr:uncharacterized protein N7511_003426 [Penicillium nucicola]KAJ5771375.1 hypothetical protein N7511_003426 [Penicillium nucicola]